MEYYRCIICYIPFILNSGFTDTATLILYTIPILASTLEDHLKMAISDAVYILNKKKSPISGLTYTELTTTAFQQTTTLLNRNILPEIVEVAFQVVFCTSEGEKEQYK